MHEFDEERIKQLQRLKNARAVLHFPFFANTFSLACHYARLVDDAPDAKTRILEHDWKKPMPELSIDALNVFYATQKAVLDDPDKDIKYAVVSQYRPRLIFAEYRPFLYAEVIAERDGRILDLDKDDDLGKDLDPDQADWKRRQTFTEAFLAIAKDLNIERFELFTDVPDQAALIEKLIKEKSSPNIPTKVVAQPVEGLERYGPEERILRLHFFGAPASTRMMRDPFRYIPFLIEDGLFHNDKTMLTCVCVADKRKPPDKDVEVPEIIHDLEDYHRSIFSTAQAAKDKQKQKALEFHEVWLAYNRLAESKQHSTVFKSPEEFAACLRTHHRDPNAVTAT